MTVAVCMLLAALGLCFIGGVVLVAVGVWAAFQAGSDDTSPVAVLLGLALGVASVGCIAGVAYHDDPPSCRLSPSSLVESLSP